MHKVETLAADLAPFFKKGGNNGYSGDGSCKRLNLCDSAVTTRRGRVSPVSPRVVTSPKSSGDAKSVRSQPFNKGVTTVTSVTTSFEQGAALPTDCPSFAMEVCYTFCSESAQMLRPSLLGYSDASSSIQSLPQDGRKRSGASPKRK
jgi:hypothetical protein